MIDLEVHDFDTLTFFKELHDKKVIGQTALLEVSRALQAGGYVAGGFVRKAMSDLGLKRSGSGIDFDYKEYHPLQVDRDKRDALYSIAQYLGREQIELNGPYKRNKNDIDIFFPSDDSRDSVISGLQQSRRIEVLESIAGNAKIAYCDSQTIIQFVTRFVAPVEEMLSSFDIVNGAIALTKDKIYVPKIWFDLERDRILKVNHWSHDQTIRRVSSWQRKHNLQQLHHDDIDFYGKKLLELFERLSRDGVIMIEGLERPIYDTKMFLRSLNSESVLQNVNGEMLVLLSSLSSFHDDYNWAFEEFKKRSSVLKAAF